MKKKKEKSKAKKKVKGRERRLELAPEWVQNRGGVSSNLLKKYRKYFGVDWECAITELEELGIEFSEVYLTSLRETISRDFKNEKKKDPIRRWEFDGYHGYCSESDENYAFIAGYTSGGAPYGVTWEEHERLNNENKPD